MKTQNETTQVRLIKTLSLLPLLAIVGCSLDDSDSQIEDSTMRARSALASASIDDRSLEAVASARACPSDLPAVLDVPADQTLAAMLPARGVQIYTCVAATPGTPPVWTLKAPHAVLGKGGDVEAIHFAGPSWQATDGSLVVGSKVAASPSPDLTAIPWLLLKASSNAGPGLFADVTYVQRLNTEGGVAPTTGCDDAHPDAQVLVPYRADYFFYHPAVSGARVRQCVSR
jgi:hypothetical protein